ncbi:MAG: lipoyl(octanoyl) transferase LipB [Bdellovibrionales bacterium]
MIESNSTSILHWGRRRYEDAEDLQKQAWRRVQQGGVGCLLGGEVELVVTQGLRGKPEHLRSAQQEPVRIQRGGQTTLHSPGQLLIYPVISLRDTGWGARAYVQKLLEISAEALRNFDVPVEWKWDPLGLWTPQGKIGFCGVQVKNGVTQHGLAINVTNDLTLFDQIISCGLTQAHYDLLSNYNSQLDVGSFFQAWCREAQRQGLFADRNRERAIRGAEDEPPESKFKLQDFVYGRTIWKRTSFKT